MAQGCRVHRTYSGRARAPAPPKLYHRPMVTAFRYGLYNFKHNEANSENNCDSSNDNYSWVRMGRSTSDAYQ
jgi:hypothetical protein